MVRRVVSPMIVAPLPRRTSHPELFGLRGFGRLSFDRPIQAIPGLNVPATRPSSHPRPDDLVSDGYGGGPSLLAFPRTGRRHLEPGSRLISILRNRTPVGALTTLSDVTCKARWPSRWVFARSV